MYLFHIILSTFLLLQSLKLCTATATCPEGYYQYSSSTNTTCKPCSECVGEEIVLFKCNRTTNTKCGCPTGKYHDTTKQFCQDCTTPKRGQILLKNCSEFENSKTADCPVGKFTSDNIACNPCTVCKTGKEEKKTACTTYSDTICKPSTTKESGFSSGTIAIARIVVGIILLIILIIIAAIVCRKRRMDLNRNMPAGMQTTDTSMNSVANVEVVAPPQIDQNSRKVTYQRCSSKGSVQNFGDQSFVTDELRWKTENMEDLDFITRDDLSKMLRPQGSWKFAASKLGFKNNGIENLDVDKQNCVMDFFKAYTAMKGASIPCLYQAIKDIQRHDVLSLFDKFLDK